MDERTIFLNALERDDPQERANYLDAACGNDQQLRRQVVELLRASGEAGEFLESPAPGLVATISSGAWDVGPDREDEASLDFLVSSEKPGCLGQLAQYEVVDIVGRGGMGLVLRAFDPKLNRVVAIKVMAPELAANPMAVKRFLREAKAAAAVSHDHVVTIHHIHDTHRPPFLVMEFVNGKSLQDKIDTSGALELREILRIGMQTASGLAAAHRQGLVHRDIKPANILLENGVERVKITDFGLARTRDDVSVTQTGQIAGTPQYMSPEQAQGQAVDHRSDLFSLGSVLYTMCTGRPPFRGDSAVAMLRRVCDDDPRPIREVNPDVPDWLDAIIARLLAKHPDDRFQSAEEVADLLSRHLAHLQHPSTSPMPQPVSVAARDSGATLEAGLKSTANYLWATGFLSLVMGILAVSVCLLAVFGFTELSRQPGLFIASGLISLPLSLAILYGAHQAERRRSYAWAMTAAVLSLVPFNLFLLFLIPVTVWTVAFLRRPNVRAAFESQQRYAGHPDLGSALPGKPSLRGAFDEPVRGQQRMWYVLGGLLAILVLFAGLAAGAWFFMDTHYGILVIESPVDDLEIERLKDGKVDRVYDTLHGGGTRWHVPVGEWEFRIKGGSREYRLDANRLAFQRGSRARLRVLPVAPVRGDAGAMEAEAVLEGFSGYPTAITFAPDGMTLLAADNGGSIRFWDLATREATPPITLHTSHIWDVVFSPDGATLASACADGIVNLWTIEGKNLQRKLSFRGHDGDVWTMSFSPDGALLATAGEDNTARVWSLETGEQMALLPLDAPVSSVAFSPDGEMLATGHGYITLWDTTTWKQIRQGRSHIPGPRIRFADDKTLYTAGMDTLIKVWRLPDLDTPAAVWLGHEEWIEDLRLSPDGRLMASVGGNWDWPDPRKPDKIRLWDTASGRQLAAFDGHESLVRKVVFSPDGQRLATCSRDGTVKLWRIPQGDSAPDGSDSPANDQSAREASGLTKEVAPQEITTAERLFTGKQDTGVFAIAVSSHGQQAISGHFGGGVSVWDVASGREVRQFSGHTDTVHAVLYGPDEQHILSSSEDATIRQWEIESAQEVRQFQGHTGRVERLALSPDRRLLVSSAADYKDGVDNTVRLWDLETGDELRRVLGQSLYTRDLLFSQDGQHVYTAGVNAIIQCVAATGQPVHRFPRRSTVPICLALSPDGRRLAAGYAAEAVQDGRWFDPENCQILLWDLPSRSVVQTFRGHTGPLSDLTFTPDGRRLLSVAEGEHNASGTYLESSDLTMRLWEVASGRELARYHPLERVRVVAMGPDGEWFLSGGESLRLWRLPQH